MTRWERRPTAAELGLEVTIGIVARSVPDSYFVAVADQMLSYADIFPATEEAARKIIKIADEWHVLFAGDSAAFKSVILKVIPRLRAERDDVDNLGAEAVKRVCTKAYAEAFAEEFASRHLIQLGYGSVAEFRREGASELGSVYQEYIEKLAKFDLGVELAVFGYDARVPWIFDVVNPGRTLDAGILGYTVVGSGYHMAMGSLRNRPLDRGLEDLIYRLLEAKFSAETATGVGKTTTLIAVNPDGISRQMSSSDIEAVRKIWQAALKSTHTSRGV